MYNKNTKSENYSKPKQIIEKQRNRVEDVQRTHTQSKQKKLHTYYTKCTMPYKN